MQDGAEEWNAAGFVECAWSGGRPFWIPLALGGFDVPTLVRSIRERFAMEGCADRLVLVSPSTNLPFHGATIFSAGQAVRILVHAPDSAPAARHTRRAKTGTCSPWLAARREQTQSPDSAN